MNKTSIVTGGGSGLGLEFVKLLLNDDFYVIVIDYNKEHLENIKKIIDKEKNDQISLIQKDLSKPNAALEIYNKLKNIKIDILINNAGFGLFGKFYNTNWEVEKKMIMLHVLCTTEMTKLFLKDMIKRNNGKILNMSSLAAFQPGPLMSIYYSTKTYILHFSEAIANELKDTSVSITVLCPGQTKTDFQRKVSSKKVKISFNISSAKEVAEYGYNALKKGKVVAVPGLFNKILSSIHRFIPRSFATRLMRKIQEKNRDS